MSPVVRIPAHGRNLVFLLLLLPLSCLFRGTGIRVALSEGGDKDWTLLQMDQDLPELGRGLAILAMASRSRSLPESWREPGFREALKVWVRRGGHLLLLGYAASYAEELELAGPAQVGAHVFGRRGNSDARGYQFGLDLPDALAKQLELPSELVLGGGTHGRVEYCLFDEEARGNAEVLGTYFRRVEGKREASPLAGLLRWQVGKGSVTALGLAPLSTLQGRSLIATLSASLGEEREGAWVALPIVAPDPLVDQWVARKEASSLPALHEAPSGLVPRLAHYGLALPLEALGDAAGEDLLELALTKGADLFLASVTDQGTSHDSTNLRSLARNLHQNGALLALDLLESPVGASWPRGPGVGDEMRVLLEQGTGTGESLDGWGGKGLIDGHVIQDPLDLWSLHPGAFLLGSDPEPGDSAASVGQIRPDAGRIRDLPVRGLIDPELSLAYPPRLYSLLHLDPDPAHGGYRDWLHAQVRDFLRNREVEASAVVLDLGDWRGNSHLASLLDALKRPFSSARSYRLSATGKGGQREALTELVAEASPSLRALSEAPCSRMVIENRFLRLEGTEGSLLVDRDRAADFSIGRESRQRLSSRFMSTRLRGARPGPDYVVKVQKQLRLRKDLVDPEGGHILHLPASGDVLPSRISPQTTALVDKALQLSPGTYELRMAVRSRGRGSLVEVRLDDRVLGFLACSGGKNKSEVFRFGIAQERTAHLILEHRHGEEMQLLDLGYEKVEDAGIEVRTLPASGTRALVVEEVGSSFLTERRRILTLGDLPAICLEINYDKVSTGLRVDRFFAFEGYELSRVERLERGNKVFFRLEDPSGIKPDLILIASGLGRNHHLSFHAGEGLAMRSYPRSKGGFRLGLVLAEELGMQAVDALELWTALDEVVHPPKLKWEQGERSFAWPWSFVWRRCAILPRKAARPIQILEGGLWRGILPGSSGDQGDSILVAGGPGHLNSVRLGEWIGPRPLPGSARLLSYESETNALELSRLSVLCPRPGVRLKEDQGSPSLDGEPWDYHYADKLWLPRRPGRYRMGISVEPSFRPSLVATTGNVERCRYDESSRELSLVLTDPRPSGKASERLFALEILGPRPTSIRGAVLAEPGRESPAGRIRLLAKPGEVRIYFGEAAHPGR